MACSLHVAKNDLMTTSSSQVYEEIKPDLRSFKLFVFFLNLLILFTGRFKEYFSFILLYNLISLYPQDGVKVKGFSLPHIL